MTPQEIFTKAYTHVIQQGEQCIGSSGACQYRGLKGNMCALGPLIDDETALKWDQIGGVHQLAAKYNASELPDWFMPNFSLLAGIQNCHDNADSYVDFLTGFKASMQVVAEVYELEVPL